MPSSYNGWSAGPGWSVAGGQLVPLVVAGEPFSPGVRAGDVFTVLQYVANALHNRVEPIVRSDWHQADDWGYAYRPNVNNPSSLSCHASGTAFDYNATRHPNGKGGTWTAAQKAEINKILAEVGNVVKTLFGYDEMHFEISGNAAQVAAVAARLRGGVTPTSPPPGLQYEARVNAPLGARVLKLGSVGDDVAFVQRWHGLAADGYFGPATESKIKETQARNGAPADGVVGPVTWGLMGVGGAAPAPVRVAPRFPLPAGHYYGLKSGPNESHGGFYASERDEIRKIQAELIRRGHVPGKSNPDATTWDDGDFGTPTEQAVRRFQSAQGLAVDGQVGPKTWARLFS